ncbi:MAG TPA: hypothetical protein DCS05_02525 [Nitrospiraceae bacterium]|nr:hypothetical protein [Nitrospiraceae bacterium]
MKLIVLHGFYGHVELAETDVVKDGKFAGLDQRGLFEKIMLEGYGNNVPAVFHAEYQDGSVKMFKDKDAAGLIDDPLVREITVLAPIAGGCAKSPRRRQSLTFNIPSPSGRGAGVRVGFVGEDVGAYRVRPTGAHVSAPVQVRMGI